MTKLKKFLKVSGVIVGTGIGVCVLGLCYVGLGQIFIEQYHDPDNWAQGIAHSSRYGWSLKTLDGWTA